MSEPRASYDAHSDAALASFLTERQFQRQVTDLASLLGWKWWHPWLSIHSDRGWPDLALCRPPRLILAELKTDRGKLTPSQAEWLEMLGRCPGVEAHCWRPSQWAEIVQTLECV